jgi:SNF2 family DNA or RNA helicase
VLRVATRPDWYLADQALAATIAQAPGIQPAGVRWELHRSHLPLLDDPEARRIILPSERPDWAARDALTAGRGFRLRNVQHAAVDFIVQRRGTLLGDEMRIGKTLAAIMAHDPASGPFVVICPAMVRPVWISWLNKVFPGEPIGVFEGRTFDPKVVQHRLIVGHYDVLAWWQSARPIGTIVFDEAHALTNRDARRAKAAVYLASRAQRVICATGTPIWNMPPDLWNVLTIIAPGAFGGYNEFSQRYGAPQPTAYGTKYTGVSNEGELHSRLSEVMIRRRWVDVADDLPPISRNVVLVDLDVRTRIKLDLLAAQITQDKSSTIGHLSRYREQLSHIKAPAVIAEATTMLDRGEPVVIWTWHVELAKKIAEELGERAFLLTGDVSGAKRDIAIAAWNAHPAGALVCTMAVAQVGLDFSHAHLAIFAEIDYTPAILAQAEMRTYAPTRPMNITYVVANHLIDQRIVFALTRKLDAANPLGVGAANDAISALHVALNGPDEEADMDRLFADIMAGA